MNTRLKEAQSPPEKTEEDLDETLKDTFPASDPPPSTGGITKLQKGSSADSQTEATKEQPKGR